jgi:hypothetical protein
MGVGLEKAEGKDRGGIKVDVWESLELRAFDCRSNDRGIMVNGSSQCRVVIRTFGLEIF